MSISPSYAVAVWRRNASMYRRTWKWNILPNFFEPVFYLFSIGLGVGAYLDDGRPPVYCVYCSGSCVRRCYEWRKLRGHLQHLRPTDV